MILSLYLQLQILKLTLIIFLTTQLLRLVLYHSLSLSLMLTYTLSIEPMAQANSNIATLHRNDVGTLIG